MTDSSVPRRAWRPELFEGVPGSPEVSHWHIQPDPPLRIIEVDVYRDGGTGFMTIEDSRGQRWGFCFDKFLGRLCTGPHTSDDQAAYVCAGSQLETDVFSVMAETVKKLAQRQSDLLFAPLPQLYEQALVHSGRPPERHP